MALPYSRSRRERHDAAHDLPGRTSRSFELCCDSGREWSSQPDLDRQFSQRERIQSHRDTDPLFSAPFTVFSNTNASLPSSAFGGTITATDNPPALQAGQSLYYRLQSEDDFRPQSPLAGIFKPFLCSPPGSAPRRGSQQSLPSWPRPSPTARMASLRLVSRPPLELSRAT